MEEEESPDAEFIRDLQDFFLPYSTADADQEVVLDLTLQYFTLLRICYKITQVIIFILFNYAAFLNHRFLSIIIYFTAVLVSIWLSGPIYNI